MTIVQKKKYQIEVTEDDAIQIRENTVFVEDSTGEILSKDPSYHRRVLTPWDTVDANEHPQVKNIAQAVFTPETVAYWNAKRNSSQKRNNKEVIKAKEDATEEEITLAEAEFEAAQAALEAAQAAWEAQYDS